MSSEKPAAETVDCPGGQFGRYQATQLLLALLPVLFTAMSQNNFVFAAAATNYRCLVPECESPEAPWSLPAWWPPAADARCSRPTPVPPAAPAHRNCSADLFGNRTEACTRWIYEDHYTIVSELGLACQEWKRTLVGTVHNVGVLVSMPLLGYVSDRWGRRPALIISATGAATGALKPLTTHAASSATVRYLLYLALELLEAAVATATYTTAFVLMLELLGDDKRIVSAVALGLAISAGAMLLALLSWRLPYWQHLQLAIYCPALVFISYWFLLDESLRWLLTTGRTDRAEQLIVKMAKWNRRGVSDKDIEMKKGTTTTTDVGQSAATEQFSVRLLLSSPVLLKRLLICSWWWFSTAFVYYGLLINSVSLPGRRALNFALAAAAGAPGELAAGLAMRYSSRRRTLAAGLLAAGVCCIASSLVPKEAATWQIAVYLLGTTSITLCFNVVYTYTSELMPTSCRTTLVGACSMLARVGSVLAPLTPLLSVWWAGLPTAVMGGAALSGAVLALAAPDTRGRALPDTVAQAQLIQ